MPCTRDRALDPRSSMSSARQPKCVGNESAISRSRLYFPRRSPRAGAPDLIWPHPEPTADTGVAGWGGKTSHHAPPPPLPL